ncbi:MAG: phage tail protein [Spongiibacteraceae bacterium]
MAGDISLSANFQTNVAKPLDDKTTVADITARDALGFVYPGLETYVVSEDKYYSWDGAQWNERASGGGGESVPVGTVVAFRFATAPAGYLLLDGSTYNVDDYPALGALYGGTGGGTFDVDDWSDLPIFGAGTDSAGDVVGADTVDLEHGHTTSGTAASAGDHSHTTGSSGSQAVGVVSLLGQGAPPNHTHTVSTTGAHTHSVTGTAADSLGEVDKRPRRAVANWIIKAA